MYKCNTYLSSCKSKMVEKVKCDGVKYYVILRFTHSSSQVNTEQNCMFYNY